MTLPVGSGAIARTAQRAGSRWSIALFAAVLVAACSGGSSERVARAELPNIVVIVTDDQRWDSLDHMPRLSARTDWARFEQAFVELPQCCPSRATFLTGRYAHHTGVETLRDGEDLDESRTIATMLDDAGYRTGFIGKYLNGFPFGDPYVPPGWDYFSGYRGGTHYFDYRLIEDGAKTVEHGSAPDEYSTDVFTRKAVDFLRGVDESEPFFLYVAPNAPHGDRPAGLPIPAPRHATACAGSTFEPPPSFDATDAREPTPWLQTLAPVNFDRMNAFHTATCRTLQALDEGVATLFAELESTGRLDDTYVVFTSDNGFSFGEHRLVGKGHLYDESVRVPLLVRGPDVRPGLVERLTSNIDLAPHGRRMGRRRTARRLLRRRLVRNAAQGRAIGRTARAVAAGLPHASGCRQCRRGRLARAGSLRRTRGRDAGRVGNPDGNAQVRRVRRRVRPALRRRARPLRADQHRVGPIGRHGRRGAARTARPAAQFLKSARRRAASCSRARSRSSCRQRFAPTLPDVAADAAGYPFPTLPRWRQHHACSRSGRRSSHR
ncbi:MAG: hypothetical protein KatS3mg010_0560 [Acidimicrobiia bacterium]|nr:MAG: hypothetical protein KatS3mg010_0560 [Acidimicrobiia bacterium]